jgi:hypothetical protein
MTSTTPPGALGVSGELARLGRAARQLGVRGAIRLAVVGLGRLAYLREAHVWYRLDLLSDLQRVELPRGMALVNGLLALRLLEQLPDVRRRVVRRRISEGAELWIAHCDGRAVLSCWCFRKRTPALPSRGGWIDLPPATMGLDGAVGTHDAWGTGEIAAGWSALAGALADEGAEALVTKVEETNLPCRRAIEAVGFRAVASMQLSRIGGHARVALHLHEDGTTQFLRAQLAR